MPIEYASPGIPIISEKPVNKPLWMSYDREKKYAKIKENKQRLKTETVLRTHALVGKEPSKLQ